MQKTGNLSTFAEVWANDQYSDMLYDVLDQKNWDINGDLKHDEEVLKAHKVSVVGITNVEDWINQIRDCK